MPDVQLPGGGNHRGITDKGALQPVVHGGVHSLANPLLAVFRGYVVLVGEITGQIRHVEGRELLVIKRFDGFHECVLHLGGAIHWNACKICRCVPLQQEMVGFGVLIFGIRPGMYPRSSVAAAEICGAVIQPEGDVHSGDLLQPLFRGKALGKKGLALAKTEERGLGVLLVFLEGDDAVGLQAAAETGRHDGGIFAVGAEGSRRILVTEDFSAAGGTLEDTQGAFLVLAE